MLIGAWNPGYSSKLVTNVLFNCVYILGVYIIGNIEQVSMITFLPYILKLRAKSARLYYFYSRVVDVLKLSLIAATTARFGTRDIKMLVSFC